MPSDHEPQFAAVVRRALDRLETRLPQIVARQVPVRAILPGPVSGTARLRLADSTTVLVSGARPGDMSRLVRALETRRAVTVAGWQRADDELALQLRGVPGRAPVRLRLIGPDQPD